MADKKVSISFEQTKQMLDAAIALGQGFEKSLADGKLSLLDIPNFIAFFTVLIPAIEGAEEIPYEFATSDPEQLEELKQYLKTKLDLEDDQLESFIEDAFDVLTKIYALVKLYFIKTNDEADVPQTGTANPMVGTANPVDGAQVS